MSIESDCHVRKRWLAEPIDPAVNWPGPPRLAPKIAEMERLNPGLGPPC
jgi:hypothetical protein